MAQVNSSELPHDYRAYMPSNITTSHIIVIIAVFALTTVYIAKPAKDREHLAKWLPLEIAAVGYLISSGGRALSIYSSLRRYGGSLFGLTSKHQVIHGLPEMDRFLAKGAHILDGFPRDWALSTRVFGASDTEYLKRTMRVALPQLNASAEKFFVHEATAHAAIERCGIPDNAASLITFSESQQDSKLWERSANVRIIEPDNIAEADLFHLIRDFGACMSIPQLLGQDFLDRNPTLLDDFWTFDNDLFPLLMIGVPAWLPLKIIKNGVAARSRMHGALAEVYRRADQHLKGEPVDFGADMSDLNPVVRARAQIYNEHSTPMENRGQIDLGNLWGQNANTQPTLFWLILFVFSTPGLVEELRREIKPHVTLSDANPPRITSFDLQSLSRSCPLLKGAVYETLRMVDEPTSIRYLKKPVAFSDGHHKQNLPAGTWISASHGIANKDPTIYPDPHTFMPDRFLEVDSETGKRVPRYGKMRPWGFGPGICKGRTFAEKEIIAISAAVMSLWDIEPIGQEWVIPAMRPGTGIVQPVHDIRVIIKRRT